MRHTLWCCVVGDDQNNDDQNDDDDDDDDYDGEETLSPLVRSKNLI